MCQSWNLVSIDLKQGRPYESLHQAFVSDLRCISDGLFKPRILPLTSQQLRKWVLWSTPVLAHNATVLTMPRPLMKVVIADFTDEILTSVICDPPESQYMFTSEPRRASDDLNATILVPNVFLPRVTRKIPLDVIETVTFGPTIEYKPPMAVTTRSVGLLSLPNEMLREIFHHIPDALDAIVFGLTTERLWRVGERWIIQLISRDMTPWANTCLICVGDLVKEDDYPPSLADNHQLLVQVNNLRAAHKSSTLFDVTNKFSGLSVWHRSSDDEPDISQRLLQRTQYYTFDSNLDPNAVSHLRKAFTEWIRPALDKDTGYYMDGAPILRNLTQKVYIRGSAIPMALGNVLARLICWSSGMSNNTGVHRGPWAGDRFDICFLQTHEDEVNKTGDGADWEDVSEEVAEYIFPVSKSESDYNSESE